MKKSRFFFLCVNLNKSPDIYKKLVFFAKKSSFGPCVNERQKNIKTDFEFCRRTFASIQYNDLLITPSSYSSSLLWIFIWENGQTFTVKLPINKMCWKNKPGEKYLKKIWSSIGHDVLRLCQIDSRRRNVLFFIALIWNICIHHARYFLKM